MFIPCLSLFEKNNYNLFEYLNKTCVFSLKVCHLLKTNNKKLVGPFNPFEKYSSNWKSSPNRGENKNIWNHHLENLSSSSPKKPSRPSLSSGPGDHGPSIPIRQVGRLHLWNKTNRHGMESREGVFPTKKNNRNIYTLYNNSSTKNVLYIIYVCYVHKI